MIDTDLAARIVLTTFLSFCLTILIVGFLTALIYNPIATLVMSLIGAAIFAFVWRYTDD